MFEGLQTLIDTFDTSPPKVAQLMRQMAEQDADGFVRTASSLLRTVDQSFTRGLQYLLSLLSGRELIIPLLADPEMLEVGEAKSLAKAMSRLNSAFERDVARHLLKGQDSLAPSEICRLLEVLSAISDCDRVINEISPLLQHSNAGVRSKAAIFLGRGSRQLGWFFRQMRQPDPRLRANAVEALWSDQDTPDRRIIFGMAVRDAHNRVAANGWVGFYRIGAIEAIAGLVGMLASEDPALRASGAWAVGAVLDIRFAEFLRRLLDDPDPLIQKNAERASTILADELTRRRRAGVLRVVASVDGSSMPGERSYLLTVASGQACISSLKTLDFAPKLDGSLLLKYAVKPVIRPDHMSVVCAFPAALRDSDNDRGPFLRMMEPFASRKRRGEFWMCEAYHPAKAGEGRQPFQMLGQKLEGDEGLEQPVHMPAGIVQSLLYMLRIVRLGRGMKRIIVVCLDAADAHEDFEKLRSELAVGQTILDVVGAPDAPPGLLAVSAKTGGRSVRTQPSQIIDCVQSLVSSLQEGYQLTFAGRKGPASLVVSSPEGWAEVDLP